MKRTLAMFTTLALCACAAAPRQVAYSHDTFDAFPNVWYLAGDATQKRDHYGMLVLTDSSVELHFCTHLCGDHPTRRNFKPEAVLAIPLTAITSIRLSSDVEHAGLGEKLFWGPGYASDRSAEYIGLTYDRGNTAEAPVFKTMRAQSAAIAAKLRVRLKRAGNVVP